MVCYIQRHGYSKKPSYNLYIIFEKISLILFPFSSNYSSCTGMNKCKIVFHKKMSFEFTIAIEHFLFDPTITTGILNFYILISTASESAYIKLINERGKSEAFETECFIKFHFSLMHSSGAIFLN